MSTVNRTIQTGHDKAMAIKLLEGRPVPFTLTLTDGKHRSTAQNKLAHMWMAEIAQQKGDMTPSEVRAYCKLTIGVPLLRAENEAFREGYDRIVRPLSYEQKIDLMSEPLDLPVTRLMTTKQKTQYLDAIARHFGEQGIILTMPEDLRRELNSHPGEAVPSCPPADDGPQQPSSEAADIPPLAASSIPDDAGNSLPAHEGSVDSPSLHSAEPSTLFPAKFNIPAIELQHLKDFARKALDDAASNNDAPAKESLINRMTLMYLDALESKDARKAIDAMGPAFFAVITGKRTRAQATAYISHELLSCAVEELGGRRNG
jgi:hypothetical protein